VPFFLFTTPTTAKSAFSSNVHKSLLISCPAAGIILTRYVTLSKVGVTMNSVGLLLPIIIILAVVAALAISWFVAGEFFRIAEDKGYHWIDWNVCAEDATASHPDAAQILRNIRRDADGQDTCVVLLHDTKATGQTVKALPDMIAYFREQGYNFCTVAQMDALQCETK